MTRISHSLLLLLLWALPAWSGSVELHSHLFMNEGMTWAFKGDFFGPLEAEDWRDEFSSQANPETVRESGIEVLVASLYAHPLFTLSMRDSIRRQIEQAERFVRENPEWILAKSPDEAQAARKIGKRILILSLEGADNIIETDEDIHEFVDQKGIRIVTFHHLTNDEFGGAALLPGVGILSSPWAALRSLFRPAPDSTKTNYKGLTEKGDALLRKFIAHQVWIDLSHSSDESQKKMIPILKEAGQPLLYTHTMLRKYLGSERGIAEWQLAEVRATGGVVGVMPSEKMLKGTPGSGLQALALQHREISAAIGANATVFGSDFNGGIPHLPELWNISQVDELWRTLSQFGAELPTPLEKTVDHFLDAWKKVMR